MNYTFAKFIWTQPPPDKLYACSVRRVELSTTTTPSSTSWEWNGIKTSCLIKEATGRRAGVSVWLQTNPSVRNSELCVCLQEQHPSHGCRSPELCVKRERGEERRGAGPEQTLRPSGFSPVRWHKRASSHVVHREAAEGKPDFSTTNNDAAIDFCLRRDGAEAPREHLSMLSSAVHIL